MENKKKARRGPLPGNALYRKICKKEGFLQKTIKNKVIMWFHHWETKHKIKIGSIIIWCEDCENGHKNKKRTRK